MTSLDTNAYDVAPVPQPIDVRFVRMTSGGKVHYVSTAQFRRRREKGERIVCDCTQRLNDAKLSPKPVDCTFCTNHVGAMRAAFDVTDELLAGCMV